MEDNSGQLDLSVRFSVLLDQGDLIMTTLNVTEARANLYKLIDDTTVNHEPVVITGKRGNAVLIG